MSAQCKIKFEEKEAWLTFLVVRNLVMPGCGGLLHSSVDSLDFLFGLAHEAVNSSQ